MYSFNVSKLNPEMVGIFDILNEVDKHGMIRLISNPDFEIISKSNPHTVAGGLTEDSKLLVEIIYKRKRRL